MLELDQRESLLLPWSFFCPIIGEKMLSFKQSFEFRYRKDLSFLFYVLLANMNEPHTGSYIDVLAKDSFTREQNTYQRTSKEEQSVTV